MTKPKEESLIIEREALRLELWSLILLLKRLNLWKVKEEE